jgi:hypothetical protein
MYQAFLPGIPCAGNRLLPAPGDHLKHFSRTAGYCHRELGEKEAGERYGYREPAGTGRKNQQINLLLSLPAGAVKKKQSL